MSSPFHVLFIEDNPGDARLIQEELRASGSKTPVELEWVDRLEKGLERLELNQIQAVLLDLNLPDGTGLETLECVLARAPHMPVIVMTGQENEETAMRAMQAGAQDYLVKGQVDGRLLMRSIQYAIQRKQTEMQLADALAYTERILTSSPVGILTYKLTGECMSANAYVAQMVGATVEQLLNQNFHAIESWKHSGLYELAQKAIASKELTAADVHIITSFGKDLWVRAQFVTFQSGGEERLLLTFGDITERKQAEEALADSELRYRSLFESNPHPMWVYDLETLGFLAVNDAAVQHYGYSQDEFLAMSIKDIRPAEDVSALLDNLAEDQHALHLPTPWRHLKKDGSLIDVEITSHYVHWKDRRARLVLSDDVTARKQAEVALREAEAKYRMLVERIPAITYIAAADASSSTLYASPQVTRMLGFSQEELTDGTDLWARQIHPDDRARVLSELENSRASGKPFSAEYRIFTRDGSLVWAYDTADFVRDASNQPRFLQGVMLDITDRKHLEAQLQQNEATLRGFYESAPSLMGISELVDEDEILHVYDNPATCRFFGAEKDATNGRLSSELGAPLSARRAWIERYRESERTGLPVHFEYLHEDQENSRWLAVTVAVILEETSPRTRFCYVAEDITEQKRAEIALRDSETRYRTVMQRSVEAIYLYDAFTKRVVIANSAFLALLGYNLEEACSLSLYDIVAHDRKSIDSFLDKIFSEGGIFMGERLWRRKDGTTVPVEVTANKLEQSGGDLVFVVARDITERKKAEEKIVLQANLLGAVGSAAIATDLEGRVIYWNPAAEKLYGWSSSEALGRLITELTPIQHSREQAERIMKRLMAGKSWSGEFMVKRKDGSLFPAFISNSPFLDSNEKMIGIIGVSNDISELKQVQLALQEKEHLLSEAQRIGHIGSWRYDIIRDTLQYSEEMYHLLDVSREGFGHDSAAFLDAVYASDRPMFAKWMEDIKVRGQCKEIEFLVFHKNGELHYIRCRGAVEFDKAGKPSSFIGTAQDVTERKLAEIQIRQQIERLTALRKVDQAISSSFDLKVTLEVLLSQLASQLHVDAADVLLLDAGRQLFSYAAGRGFRTSALELTPLRLAESPALRERRPIHVQSLKNKPDARLLTLPGASEGFECYFGVPLLVKGKIQGLLEVFHRTPLQPYPEWLDFLNTMAGQAAIAIENTTLFENLERSNLELSQAYDATIEGWSRALDLRDKETEGHTRRVTEMTLALARKFGLPEEQLLYIRWGALLHDIGKMGVPDHILLKRGALTAEEWMIMRSHAQYAYELLKPIHFLTPALDIPYCHHERWDGTGYPRGLKGEEIPLAARLFAVVDVWDALRSDRPYRPAWTVDETKEHICAQAGRHFDPRVVESFLKILL